jgi:hypothetical protein
MANQNRTDSKVQSAVFGLQFSATFLLSNLRTRGGLAQQTCTEDSNRSLSATQPVVLQVFAEGSSKSSPIGQFLRSNRTGENVRERAVRSVCGDCLCSADWQSGFASKKRRMKHD